MVCLGDRAKKGMTAIRFYLLEDIDIFYDGRGLRREGSKGSARQGQAGSQGSEGGGGRPCGNGKW